MEDFSSLTDLMKNPEIAYTIIEYCSAQLAETGGNYDWRSIMEWIKEQCGGDTRDYQCLTFWRSQIQWFMVRGN